MAKNTVVCARVDERAKNDATVLLAEMGLTVSDALRLLMMKIAADKPLPFDPLTPNAETIAAMEAARRGELVTAGSPDDLIASLNAAPCPAS